VQSIYKHHQFCPHFYYLHLQTNLHNNFLYFINFIIIIIDFHFNLVDFHFIIDFRFKINFYFNVDFQIKIDFHFKINFHFNLVNFHFNHVLKKYHNFSFILIPLTQKNFIHNFLHIFQNILFLDLLVHLSHNLHYKIVVIIHYSIKDFILNFSFHCSFKVFIFKIILN